MINITHKLIGSQQRGSEPRCLMKFFCTSMYVTLGCSSILQILEGEGNPHLGVTVISTTVLAT